MQSPRILFKIAGGTVETRPSYGFGALQPNTDELLTALINSANHLVWCTSLDGSQLLYANPVAARVYGRPLEELLVSPDYWIDAIHPDDRVMVLKNLNELMERQEIEQEYRIVRPDNSVIWLHDRLCVVRDAGGKPMYVGGIGTDITAIRESEALYSSLVESLPLHVIRKDLEGRVVFGNQRYCQSIGLSLEDLIGKTDHDLFPADLAQKYCDDDRRVLETGRVFNDIEEHENASGERVFVEIFKGPVRDSLGKINGIQVMYWDVTERKRAQEEVRVAKELAEKANRAKSEFLANMSHEIRTPMNGIIGMTELLLNTTPSAEQRNYLNMVKQSADSLLRLLNDILDFSKIEAGRLDLDCREFSLRDCVGRTVQTLGSHAGQKRLELLCRFSPEIPDVLYGDAGRLGQIVVNLVGNAIKFTERGEVEVEVTAARCEESQISLQFSVRDTGIGIPPEQQRKIFDSFRQLDASTTRRFGGTGLGLAISSQLVEMMDGRIEVESVVDQGTTFRFTVRLGVHGSGAMSPETEQLRGLRVLVVDDNRRSREILQELLQSWGLAASGVERGALAIEQLAGAAGSAQPYRIVILDCLMPVDDGFQIAERIGQQEGLGDCELIMLSSATRPGDVERCRGLGIRRYMQKPVVQSELLGTLLQLTGAIPYEDASRSEPTGQPTGGLRRLRILVAEDGIVNQQVAIGLLEQHGHDVTIANDGREAVEAMDQQPFDLVLMDVQMPNMDGHEATRIIRRKEQQTKRHTPIVAMTASAMKGDAQRCIDSGMDDYVSKPISPRMLYEAIGRNTADASAAGDRVTDRTAAEIGGGPDVNFLETATAIDIDATRELCGGDDEKLRILAESLLDESALLMKEIRAAVTAADADSVRRFAHSLKGAASVFHASAVVDAALLLERVGESGNPEQFESQFSDLESEVAGMTAALQMLVNAK